MEIILVLLLNINTAGFVAGFRKWRENALFSSFFFFFFFFLVIRAYQGLLADSRTQRLKKKISDAYAHAFYNMFMHAVQHSLLIVYY